MRVYRLQSRSGKIKQLQDELVTHLRTSPGVTIIGENVDLDYWLNVFSEAGITTFAKPYHESKYDKNMEQWTTNPKIIGYTFHKLND